ncbi:hypothetical protein ATKI12_1345 [Kitasatospora sp. Ki12]
MRGNLSVRGDHWGVSGRAVWSEATAEREHRHVPSPIHVVGGVSRRSRPPW